jgi:glycosyltransferase involved in cell wall biosynthesis
LPTEQVSLQQLAADLGVQTHVTFHEVLSATALQEQLQRNHVFVMLSEHLPNGDFEGFGIAILEANSYGLPAIGSINSGISDAIQDGYSGKLVDPHHPKAIKEALQEIQTNYDAYSSQAKEWATHFQWKEIVTNYCQLWES